MVALIEPEPGSKRRHALIDFCRSEPAKALLAAAIALDELPGQGARCGPALRELTGTIRPETMYEALLTDIRDFLKLRFRVVTPQAAPAEPKKADPELVIPYVIHALDDLSRGSPVHDLPQTLGPLRDLLAASANELVPPPQRPLWELVFRRLGKSKVRGSLAGQGQEGAGREA